LCRRSAVKHRSAKARHQIEKIVIESTWLQQRQQVNTAAPSSWSCPVREFSDNGGDDVDAG